MACDRGLDKGSIRTWGTTSETNGGQVRVTLSDEQTKALFKRFDSDGDGRINKQELKDAFHSLDSRFPAWRAWRALYHADANNDGYISEKELEALIEYCVKHGYSKK